MAPRFLGIDEQGRQVVSYLEGTVIRQPRWQHDDRENAKRLGELASVLRSLHDVTESFRPPRQSSPRRPLPIPGSVWTHGDPGYPNVVYRHSRVAGLIDWEFAAPADPICDPAALLAVGVRGPRPDAHDHPRRARAVMLAAAAIADCYAMSNQLWQRLPMAAALVLDDTARHWRTTGADDDEIHRLNWRANWFRNIALAA